MRLFALAMIVGVVMVASAGCGSGEEPVTAPWPSTEHETLANPGASEAEPTPRVERVVVAVTAGKVDGPSEPVRVPVGGEVELVVTSDVADGVHVHGIDKFMEVEAGKAASLRFTAPAPGRYEVELERSKLGLLEFEVR